MESAKSSCQQPVHGLWTPSPATSMTKVGIMWYTVDFIFKFVMRNDLISFCKFFEASSFTDFPPLLPPPLPVFDLPVFSTFAALESFLKEAAWASRASPRSFFDADPATDPPAEVLVPALLTVAPWWLETVSWMTCFWISVTIYFILCIQYHWYSFMYVDMKIEEHI